MNTNVKKLVIKKKRRRIIKRLILGLFILIIGTIIFIYKTPIFNLKNINITGLVNLNNESLQELLKYNLGQNIFTIDYNKIEEDLKENPYIKEVKISKKGINKISINIVEDKIAYYLNSNDKYKTINNEGIIVEELETLDDRSLTKLTGIDVSDKNIGEKISDDTYISVVLEDFYKMIEVLPTEYRFSEINILDLNNISCIIGDIEIKLGDNTNLFDKVNVALNIIEQGIIKKGYIDMSFDGAPVIKQIE